MSNIKFQISITDGEGASHQVGPFDTSEAAQEVGKLATRAGAKKVGEVTEILAVAAFKEGLRQTLAAQAKEASKANHPTAQEAPAAEAPKAKRQSNRKRQPVAA